MTILSRPTLPKHTRAAWRRAADELLIDAIFGSAPTVIRDDTIIPAAARSRVRDLSTLATITQTSAVSI